MFQIESMNHRTFIADVIFLFKCLHGQSYTPGPGANASLRTPRYNWVSSTFYPNMDSLHVLSRLHTYYNTAACKVDIFDTDIRLFSALLKIL